MNYSPTANTRIYRMSKDELVREIIKVLKTNGEEMTDGECLDEIVSILHNEGYMVDFETF